MQQLFLNFIVHLTAAQLHFLLAKKLFANRKDHRLLNFYWWNMLGCVLFHLAVAGQFLSLLLEKPDQAWIAALISRCILGYLAAVFAALFLPGFTRLPKKRVGFARLVRPLSQLAPLIFRFGMIWATVSSIAILLFHFGDPELATTRLVTFLANYGSLSSVLSLGLIWLLINLAGLEPDDELSFGAWPYRVVVIGSMSLYFMLMFKPPGAVFFEMGARFSSVGFALVFAWDRLRLVFLDVIVKQGLRFLILGSAALAVVSLLANDLETPQQQVRLLFYLFMLSLVFYFTRNSDRWLDRMWFRHAIDRDRYTDNLMNKLHKSGTRVEARQATEFYLSETFLAEVVIDKDGIPASQRVMISGEPELVISLGRIKGLYPWYSEGLELVRTAGLLLQGHLKVVRAIEKQRAEELRARELSELATEAELRALRAQIRPHFLFNVLNTIHAFVKSRPDEAEETIELLADLMRGVLQGSRGDVQSLKQELALAETYLSIEKIRHGQRLHFSFHIPNELAHLQVPSFSLQPLVENAVKHGIDAVARPVTIEIGAESDGVNLLIRVCDNGPGLSRGASHKGLGLASKNIRDRLVRLYGDRADLTLINRPEGGAESQLRIPLAGVARRNHEEVAHD